MKKGGILITGEIDAKTVRYVYDRLQEVLLSGVREVEVYISSPGGEAEYSFAIYGMLKRFPRKIRTVGTGQVMSGATIIFLAGDTREIVDPCKFMVHTVTVSELAGKVEEIRNELLYLEDIQESMIDIYRSFNNKTKAWWKKTLSRDTYLTYKQLKDLGFID